MRVCLGWRCVLFSTVATAQIHQINTKATNKMEWLEISSPMTTISTHVYTLICVLPLFLSHSLQFTHYTLNIIGLRYHTNFTKNTQLTQFRGGAHANEIVVIIISTITGKWVANHISSFKGNDIYVFLFHSNEAFTQRTFSSIRRECQGCHSLLRIGLAPFSHFNNNCFFCYMLCTMCDVFWFIRKET